MAQGSSCSSFQRKAACSPRREGPSGPSPAAPPGTYLVRLVEEEAEVGEDYPQLLPPVAVFEFPQQVPRQLILQDKSACKEPGGKANSVSQPGGARRQGRASVSRLPGGDLRKRPFALGGGLREPGLIFLSTPPPQPPPYLIM